MNSLHNRSAMHARRGLSLVEVLISLALSSVLLIAVYQAISLYFRTSTAGQEEVTRAQIARVLLRTIENDLRSVVYQESSETGTDSSTSTSSTNNSSEVDPKSGADGNSGAKNSSSSSTTTETTMVQDPADAYGGANAGLFGSQQSLVIHISKPRMDLFDPNQNQMVKRSDLKSVAYFMSGTATGGLQAMAAASFAAQGKAQANGLARMEGERFALQMAEKQGNVSSLVGQTDLLSPEVTNLQFRFFDGTQWLTQWDSTSYGGLPKAVEIQLQLQFAAKVTGTGLRKKTKDDTPHTYRAVVSMPLSAVGYSTNSSY